MMDRHVMEQHLGRRVFWAAALWIILLVVYKFTLHTSWRGAALNWGVVGGAVAVFCLVVGPRFLHGPATTGTRTAPRRGDDA